MSYLQATARTSAPTPRLASRGPAVLPRLACLMWFRGSDTAGLIRAALVAFCWLGGQGRLVGYMMQRPLDCRSWRGSARPLSGLLRFPWTRSRARGRRPGRMVARRSTRALPVAARRGVSRGSIARRLGLARFLRV